MSQTISSPIQAARTFANAGGFPRQKHLFLARFLSPGRISNNVTNLTFAMKSIDRPKIQPKTELLNQYNKKRQIYTGYTIEPIRAQLIDSKDGAAQNMWANYSRFYFGDFATTTKYNYDVTTPQFNSGSYGYTASNNGAAVSLVDAQFYFHAIEIYHFYDGVVDQYNLINPRITAFEPDDLDYANSEVSTINITFACENVQYKQQQKVSPANFPEFTSGRFWGNPLEVSSSGSSPYPASFSDDPNDYDQSDDGEEDGGGFFGGSNPLGTLGDIFSTVQKVTGVVNNFRSGNITHALGSLSQFGNFSFGGITGGGSLASLADGNPSLAHIMALGSGAVQYGINSQQYANAAAAIQGQSSGYGSGPTAFSTAVAAAQQITRQESYAAGPDGVVLSPTAYAAVNVQQTGTAQYGYNPSDPNTDEYAGQ